MHVIQVLDADDKVVSTRSKQDRTEAYETFDRVLAEAEPGTVVIMREGGQVYRRDRKEEPRNARTDVSEATRKRADRQVDQRAGGENEGAGDRGGDAGADPDVRGAEVASPATVSLAPRTVAQPDE